MRDIYFHISLFSKIFENNEVTEPVSDYKNSEGSNNHLYGVTWALGYYYIISAWGNRNYGILRFSNPSGNTRIRYTVANGMIYVEGTDAIFRSEPYLDDTNRGGTL